MQAVVQSVFLVVVSVVGTLLTVGLTGIIAILAMDHGTSVQPTPSGPEVNRHRSEHTRLTGSAEARTALRTS